MSEMSESGFQVQPRIQPLVYY